jgi:HD superfamily phosphohydrolase YqeK
MGNPDEQRNLDLKIEHTHRVCEVILDIGQSLSLNTEDLRLAEAAALLHDVGRFEQYWKYRTFMDSKSEDHAKLGVSVLEKKSVLEDLDENDARIIRCAVLYHNRLIIPEEEDGRCLLHCRLLRDADKIDVYKVVTDYYQIAHESPNEAIQLDLPDRPEISVSVMEDIRNKQVVKKEHLQTLNDFKLLQMGWIYDINFPHTFDLIRERQYLDLILQSMPIRPDIHELGRQLETDLDRFCAAQPTQGAPDSIQTLKSA